MRFLFVRLPQPPTNWRNCMSTLTVIRFNSSCSTRHSYIYIHAYIHYHYHYHYHFHCHCHYHYHDITLHYIHVYIYIMYVCILCVCVDLSSHPFICRSICQQPLQYSIGPASSEGVLVETTLRTSGALRPTTFAVGTGQGAKVSAEPNDWGPMTHHLDPFGVLFKFMKVLQDNYIM